MVHSQSINDYVFGMGHGARAQDGHAQEPSPKMAPTSIHAPRTWPDAWRGGGLPPRGGHTAPALRAHPSASRASPSATSHRITRAVLSSTHVWHNPRQITLCDYTPTTSLFLGKRGLFRMNQRHTRAPGCSAQSRHRAHARRTPHATHGAAVENPTEESHVNLFREGRRSDWLW